MEKTLITEELLNALVVSAKSGDDRAVKILEDACYSKMHFLALLYRLDEKEADRAVREGYGEVFANRAILNTLVKFEPWVMRNVSAKALKILKEKHEAEGTPFLEYPEEEGSGFVYDVADEKNTEEGSLTEDPELRKTILQELFRSFTDEKRVISLMYFYEEMSIMEIAEELHLAQPTVVYELTSAKKILKEAVTFQQIEKMFHIHHSSPISFFISLLKDEYHEPLRAEEAEAYRELAESMTRTRDILISREFAEPKPDPKIELEKERRRMLRRKRILIGFLAVLVAGAGLFLYYLFESNNERIAHTLSYEEALQSLRIEFVTDENGLEPSVFEYGSEKIDLRSFVASYEGKLEFKKTDVLDTSEVGTVEVIYTLSAVDAVSRKVEWNVVRHYTVLDTQAPVIEFEKELVEIEQGDEFDPIANITAVKDPADGNIALTQTRPSRLINADSGKTYEYNWYMVDSDVNTNVEGEYTVTVHAEDIHGNSTEKTYRVKVGQKLIMHCYDYAGGTRRSCELGDGKYEGKYTSLHYETQEKCFRALREYLLSQGKPLNEYRIIEVCDFREQPLYYYFQCE